jgi:hypothetical protein
VSARAGPEGSPRRARQRTARRSSTAADSELRERAGSHPVGWKPTGRVRAPRPTGRVPAQAPGRVQGREPTGPRRVQAPGRVRAPRPPGRVPAQAPGPVQGREPRGPGRAQAPVRVQAPAREPMVRSTVQGPAQVRTMRAPRASVTARRPGLAARPGAGRARLGRCSGGERSRARRRRPRAAPYSSGARRPLSVIADRPKCASPARTSARPDFLHVPYPPCRGCYIDLARRGEFSRNLRTSCAGIYATPGPDLRKYAGRNARSDWPRLRPKGVLQTPRICSRRAGARRARRAPAAARAGPASAPSGGSRGGRMSRTRAARGGPGFRSGD